MAEGEPRVSSRIFISYRREDSTGFVRAMLAPLRARFGRERVFKDTDNIPPGQDFVKAITRELESCKVFLAVIGSEWASTLDARTKERRLDNPNDTLRVEVAAALRNELITVIPVLVDRANMPRQDELPEELWALTRRNAVELSDARWDVDVESLVRAIEIICGDEPAPRPGEAPETQEPQTRRSGDTAVIDRLLLRRQRQIAEHLKTAREAFEAEDYQTVLSECERAIWLDPDCAEARDLAARAQAALDERNIKERLDEAQRALARGELSAASESIDQALARNHDHPEALKLRQELLKRRLERDRLAEVTRVVAAELESARARLNDKDFAAALSHVDEALALSPESAEAQALSTQIAAARADAVRARDHRRRAQQTIAEAQAAWADGRHEAALTLLTNFAPSHDLVAQAIVEFRARITQAEEFRRKAEAAQAEAAALTRSRADEKLAQVATAIAEKRYDAAQELIDAARGLDPANPALIASQTSLTEAVAADAAAERAREAQAAEAARRDAERREVEAAEALGRARRAASAKLEQVSEVIAERRYDVARELIETARQLDPGHPDLSLWTQRIDEAIAVEEAAKQERRQRQEQAAREEAARREAVRQAAERARRDADAKLAQVAAAIAEKRYAAARQLVDEARRLDSTHPAIATWRTRIDNAVAADDKAETEKREREAKAAREEADRQAAIKAAAERARREADRKLAQLDAAVRSERYDGARALLEEARLLDPEHPDLVGWPARIATAEREGQERAAEAARQESERQAAAKAAAERARAGADGKLAGVQAAIDAGRHAQAQQLVVAARALDPAHPALDEWQQRVDSAVAEREAADRAREQAAARAAREDAERQQHARRTATATLARVKAALKERRYQAARELLAEARLADPTHPALSDWAKKIEQQERAPEETGFSWKKPVAVAAVVLMTATVGTLVYRVSRPAVPSIADAPQTPTPQEQSSSNLSNPSVPAVSGGTPADNTTGPSLSTNTGQGPTGLSSGATSGQTGGVGLRSGGAPAGRRSSPAASEGRRGVPAPSGGNSGAPAGSTSSRSNTTQNQKGTNAVAGSPPGAGATTENNPRPVINAPAGPEPPRSASPPPTTVGQQPEPATLGGTGLALPTPEQLAEQARQKQLADDEAAIRRLLPLYAQAYAAKDDAQLRRLIPGFRGIPNKELIRRVTVKLGEPKIVISGRSATLLVAQILEYEWERPGLPPSGSGTVTWNLERDSNGSTWRIVSSNFR